MSFILSFIAVAFVSVTLWTFQALTSVDAIRFYTITMITINTLLIQRHSRRAKRTEAIVTRQLGERPKTDAEPWDGVERRGTSHSN